MNIDRDRELVEDWFWKASADKQPFDLQVKNLAEEAQEFIDAEKNEDKVEVFDALVDMYWVTLGILNTIEDEVLARKLPFKKGFDEVAYSNFSKFKRVYDENGPRLEVLKREDGKILKHPDTYEAPDLKKILNRYETK